MAEPIPHAGLVHRVLRRWALQQGAAVTDRQLAVAARMVAEAWPKPRPTEIQIAPERRGARKDRRGAKKAPEHPPDDPKGVPAPPRPWTLPAGPREAPEPFSASGVAPVAQNAPEKPHPSQPDGPATHPRAITPTRPRQAATGPQRAFPKETDR